VKFQNIIQIWTVAANILNKQSRRAEKGWFCSSGVQLIDFNFTHIELGATLYCRAVSECLIAANIGTFLKSIYLRYLDRVNKLDAE